jgi:high affinity Mn2+ porin
MLSRHRAAFAVCVLISVAPVAGASAADLFTKAPIAQTPVPLVWTGWYAGGAIGYASGEVTLGSPSTGGAGNLEPSGIIGLIHAGADYQFANNFVLGARVVLPIFFLKDSTRSAGFTNRAEAKGSVLFAGRVGYAFGSYLPYVLGGFVWGRGEATTVGVTTIKQDHHGYVVGGGVEYRWLPNWSIDANYTFVSMDKETYNFVPFGGAAVSRGFESHNVTIGVNYRR